MGDRRERKLSAVLCRQDWMDEPSPRGDTGGVYGEDGVEQAGRVSESD